MIFKMAGNQPLPVTLSRVTLLSEFEFIINYRYWLGQDGLEYRYLMMLFGLKI